MSHPEWESPDFQEDAEHEPLFTVSFSKKQLEALLIAVTDELRTSLSSLDQLGDDARGAEEYDIIAGHIAVLQNARAIIAPLLDH